MNKIYAFNNCMAVFHYAIWRFSDSIVCVTSNGVTYSVDIQLEHANYDAEKEIKALKVMIAAGADITHFRPYGASYDLIVIRYRYDN